MSPELHDYLRWQHRYPTRCQDGGRKPIIHLLISGIDSKEAAKTALMGKNNVGGGDFEAPTSLIPRDTERTIAKTVKEQNIDIQIMGAYAHSPICSLLFGSKIADLLRSVTIPTILLC